MKYVIATVVAAVGLSATPAVARDNVSLATRALLAAQKPEDGSWSWTARGAKTAPNAAGIVASALLRSHAANGDAAALDAVKTWGESRLADLEAWRPVYDPDIVALAELGRVAGDARFSEAARTAFSRRWGEATGREAYARLAQRRGDAPFVLGYDAALAIQAATAVGERGFAHALARQVIRRQNAWDPKAWKKVPEFATTSRATVLEALLELDGRRYKNAAGQLAARLVKTQAADGSWAGQGTQATARAVSALSKLGGAAAEAAREKGAAWLRQTQDANGLWRSFPTDDDGAPVHAVTAEAMAALSTVG